MREQTLAEWKQACAEAFQSRWGNGAGPLVFGDGKTATPALMLIGEAPGEQEAREGKPFVGKAGKNLTAFLQSIELERSELYVSNVVKIRPSRLSAAGRIVNRPPNRAEIDFFLPWLYREIALVKPQAIVTLGNVALHAFLPENEMIGQCHGRWHEVVISANERKGQGYRLFALYHPASVIYNRSLATVYQRDVCLLRDSFRGICAGDEPDR